MMGSRYKLGDSVLLFHSEKDKWLVQIGNRDFHCKFGKIDLGSIVGMEPGETVISSRGAKLRVLDPTMEDWIRNMSHKSQIIYEKDAAMIVFLGNIRSGSVVYEAGTGSGSLTSVLGHIVGPSGKVITHEVRKEAHEAAKENIGKVGLTNIEFHLTNVENGFVDGTCDALVLDMGNPWSVVQHIPKVLRKGGKCVIFLPTFNQLEITVGELRRHGFVEIRVQELIGREIQVKESATRPATRMIGHTGFLIDARFVGIVPM